MVIFENLGPRRVTRPNAACLKHVSTGSAEKRHLQPGLGGKTT